MKYKSNSLKNNFFNSKLNLLFSFFMMTFLLSTPIISSYGHTFTSDETSLYLTFIDEMKVQKNLIKKYMQEGNYDFAQAHLTRMVELYTDELKEELAEKNKRVSTEISSTIFNIGDQIKQRSDEKSILFALNSLDPLLVESIDIRLDPSVLNNSTVHGLHFTELVNSLDTNYKHSLMSKNMVNHSETGISKISNKTSQLEHKNNHTAIKNTETIRNNVFDLASFNTAKSLLSVIKDLYNTTIKQDINQTKSAELDKINIALEETANVIDSKAPYKDLAIQVHGIIHPNVIEVYGLDHLAINQPKTLKSSGENSHS